MIDFDDDCSACEEVNVTLCIYSKVLSTDEITELTKFTPTRTTKIGDRPSITDNGWFFCTDKFVQSRDVRHHLYYLTKKLEGLDLDEITESGCEASLFCFWVSANGNGGPTINADLMREISKLGLDLDFDIYCSDQGL